jgi:hypothetical protein
MKLFAPNIGGNGYLNALMRTQVEIKFGWMSDPNIHRCPCRNVPRFARLFLLVSAEETSVMPLLNDNERDAWLVFGF